MSSAQSAHGASHFSLTRLRWEHTTLAEVSLDGLKEPVNMWKVEDELEEQMEMAFPESGAGAE